MSKNAICICLCAGALIATTVSGCYFRQNEDCPFREYCKGNELWSIEGLGEWSNSCEDYIIEDCSERGGVCQEYGDGDDPGAGCYYPDIPCDTGVRALCDDTFVYRCDTERQTAVERESCAETGRVCRAYTDDTGETAGCFYEGISCESRGGGAAIYDVCDDDFAYVCDPDAAMAFKRTDCTETGDVCVQVENWGAVCTTACTEEGARSCDASAIQIVRCSNGAWIPEEYCWNDTRCVADGQNGAVGPICAEQP